MIYRNSVNSFYVKLSKTSNTVTAFYKSEAQDEWIEIGSVELTLTGNVILVGTAVTAGDDHMSAIDTMYTQNYGRTQADLLMGEDMGNVGKPGSTLEHEGTLIISGSVCDIYCLTD